jgi:hypothetical protein
VYITQEMGGRDLSDAASFGDLDVLIPAHEQITLSTEPLKRRMQRKLQHFTDKDYLLFAGDPVAIAIAGALACAYNKGKFKALKWDRLEQKYYPVEFDLYFKPKVQA